MEPGFFWDPRESGWDPWTQQMHASRRSQNFEGNSSPSWVKGLRDCGLCDSLRIIRNGQSFFWVLSVISQIIKNNQRHKLWWCDQQILGLVRIFPASHTVKQIREQKNMVPRWFWNVVGICKAKGPAKRERTDPCQENKLDGKQLSEYKREVKFQFGRCHKFQWVEPHCRLVKKM